MNLIQLPEAELEVIEAVDFCEYRQPGLGLEFLDEVQPRRLRMMCGRDFGFGRATFLNAATEENSCR